MAIYRGIGLGMGESGVRERVDRSGRTAGLAFDPVASKPLRPLARPGVIGRSSLIDRLARGEANGQAFAWVSVDERGNDPSAMVECAAAC